MECQAKMRFNEAWEAIVASKRKGNKTSLNQEEYIDRVTQVIQLKKKDRTDMSLDNCQFLERFDTLIKNGRQYLVRPSLHEGVAPDHLQLYVTNEEMFDVLNETYLSINYHNKKRMYRHIRRRYRNVTKEAVATYLTLCASRNYRRQVKELRALSSEVEQSLFRMPPSSQSPVRGITMAYFGFVDMHRYARNGYTCIMVHWNTVTQFTHLVPLKNMNYMHVAVNLLKIYTEVGIPDFIDAPYDIPYITLIVDHIKSEWRGGNCCIKIKRSEDLEAIIEGWNAVQKVMEPWINNAHFPRKWPSKLKYIQHFTNNNNSSGSALPSSIVSPSDSNPSV